MRAKSVVLSKLYSFKSRLSIFPLQTRKSYIPVPVAGVTINWLTPDEAIM